VGRPGGKRRVGKWKKFQKTSTAKYTKNGKDLGGQQKKKKIWSGLGKVSSTTRFFLGKEKKIGQIKGD